MSDHTRTRLRTPPKVVEEDSGVGPSLSPSVCLSDPLEHEYLPLASMKWSSIQFFDTLEKVCQSGENFNWDEHDFQLNIPTGALPRQIVAKVSFGVSISGQFHLPPSMKLVSAVFLVDVSPSDCFVEDVELRIPHCVDLSIELCDHLWFIHAPFNKMCQTEVFNFKKLSGGIFKSDLEYGSICTRDFCLMAVAVDMSQICNPTRSATATPLHALTASDLPKTSVQLLPQQPIHPCYKMKAYFCIPFNQSETELVWDVYFMVSLKIPSMAKLIMKQLQEYHKLPEPIKIDFQTIRLSSNIYLDIADISDSGWTVCSRTSNQVAVEDVTDFDCSYSPDYPPHIILEVKCSETGVMSRFPGCKLTIRECTNNSEIGYYQLPSGSGSRNNSYKGKKTITMADMQLKVVPMVATKWESIGYVLGFDTEQIEIIKCDHKEVEKRCEELFRRWLSGNTGKSPKTWSVFLKLLSEIPELTAAREKLEELIN